MTDQERELNIEVAEVALGQVACPHWRFVAMGLAGWGYERLSTCPHEETAATSRPR